MQKKIFIIFTMLLVLGIVLAGLLTFTYVRSSYENNIEESLYKNALIINNNIYAELTAKEIRYIDFNNYAHEYAKLIDYRVTFIDTDGKVLGDSAIDGVLDIENHLHRPEIQKALKRQMGIDKRKSRTTDVDYIYLAVPLIINDQIYMLTRLALPLYELNLLNYELLLNYILAAFCGLVVSAILGFKYANNVTKPIKRITDSAKKIANGKFTDRVYIKSSDEIGALADTFNFMAEKLNETITEIHDKNTKLQSTLESMNEALFAVDKAYRIILINPVAMRLFNVDEDNVYGKHILEVVRNDNIHNILKSVLEDNILGELEVTIDYPKAKILRIFTNSIKLEMDPNRVIGTMALIQDITDVRKLENIRSDFVANVSHELKTPLTSIAGFVETLKNDAANDETVRTRFLNIIELETIRLTRLIDDLLSLSAIESNAFNKKKDMININEIINEVGSIVEGFIKQKSIKYTVESKLSLNNIKGNRDYFKQMLLNLIDNAVKYTQEGGTVKVFAYQRNNDLFISIKDSGPGIPKEDIPRLFERFYRVDKARSRKVGGTGLGLAIVKHIVLSFNGDIEVKSEIGRGSEFKVRIPMDSQ